MRVWDLFIQNSSCLGTAAGAARERAAQLLINLLKMQKPKRRVDFLKYKKKYEMHVKLASSGIVTFSAPVLSTVAILEMCGSQINDFA